MPKSLKQWLEKVDPEMLTDYETELKDERKRKARERAKEVYYAGKEKLKEASQ